MISLAGRSIVVVGGGSGIGWAAAELAAGLGAQVTVADVDPATANLVAGLGKAAQFVPCDARDPGDVATMLERAAERFGGIDGLAHHGRRRASGALGRGRSRRLERRARVQPDQHLRRVPGRAAVHGPARRRRHRHDQQRLCRDGRARPRRLYRGQGRRHRLHPHAGRDRRAPAHPRQLHRPGPDRHAALSRHERRRGRASSGCGPRCRSARSRSRSTAPMSRSSCCRTPRAK